MDSLHLVFAPRHLEGLDIDLDVKTPKNSDTHTPICQKRSVAAKGLGQNPLIMFLRSENLEFRQHIVAWWDVHHWFFMIFHFCVGSPILFTCPFHFNSVISNVGRAGASTLILFPKCLDTSYWQVRYRHGHHRHSGYSGSWAQWAGPYLVRGPF